MKKVAFLVNSLHGGGAERIVLNLGEFFINDEDIIGELILLEKNEFYLPKKELKISYMSELTGSENSIVKFLMLFMLALKTKNHVRKNKIDVVQSHLYRSNYINIIAKLLGSKHECQIVNHDNFFRGYDRTILGKIKLLLVRFFYRKADVVIAISEEMRVGLERVIDKEVIKINNPYPLFEIREKAREKVELAEGKRYFSTVGRLIDIKRAGDILQAFSIISEEHRNYDLLVLGDGPERTALEEQVAKLNLNDRVKFCGRVDNPFSYLGRSEFFVMASESEGFPNALIEAMACGCKVIASDCMTGPREILAPELVEEVKEAYFNRTGVLFPVGDFEALGEIMRRVIEQDLKMDAGKRVEDFDVNVIADTYKKLLMRGSGQ